MEPFRNPTTLLPATTLRSLIAPQGYPLSAPFYSHLLPFSGVRRNASVSYVHRILYWQVKLVAPSLMPKLGKAGSLQSRIAIVHSLTHTESWAIDLSWVFVDC